MKHQGGNKMKYMLADEEYQVYPEKMLSLQEFPCRIQQDIWMSKYLDKIMCTFFTLRLPFDFAQDRLFRVTVTLSPSTLLRINSVEASF